MTEGTREQIDLRKTACLTWNGATKPFFVNSNGVKVNAKSYKSHLQKQLLPSISKLFSHSKWIFFQDGAPSHGSNLVQNYMEETLGKRFVKKTEWPPSSPDCNPLDYYFWNKVKSEVYKNRFNQ